MLKACHIFAWVGWPTQLCQPIAEIRQCALAGREEGFGWGWGCSGVCGTCGSSGHCRQQKGAAKHRCLLNILLLDDDVELDHQSLAMGAMHQPSAASLVLASTESGLLLVSSGPSSSCRWIVWALPSI